MNTNQEKTINIDNKIIKLNDIFVSSWGYEQTNVDFYQVVGIKGKKTVLLRELKQERNPTGFMSGETIPLLNQFQNDEILERRVKLNFNNELDIKITSYSWASLYKAGTKKYYSEYA